MLVDKPIILEDFVSTPAISSLVDNGRHRQNGTGTVTRSVTRLMTRVVLRSVSQPHHVHRLGSDADDWAGDLEGAGSPGGSGRWGVGTDVQLAGTRAQQS
jgi:hypothetical protein